MLERRFITTTSGFKMENVKSRKIVMERFWKDPLGLVFNEEK